MRARARIRERVGEKAQIVRAVLKSRPTHDEARQLARNLGRMIDEADLRRSGGMAELKRRVGRSTFSKQRGRYVEFSDEIQKDVARDGGVFLRIAETVSTWNNPDDPELAKDEALLRLSIGIPRLQLGSTPPSPATCDASEAYSRLINLLNLGVSEIARDCDLPHYFRTLVEDGLELDEDLRFSAARVWDGFSLTPINDEEILIEAAARIPRFLPRVRVASLYRRHVATTVVIRDPELSPDESADPESMYLAGLRRLNLEPAPPSEEAYPAAPSGWDKLKHEGLDFVFERLDVWLVIAPDKGDEAARPAFIFMSGSSVTAEGDVWRSTDSWNLHANNRALYYDSAGEEDGHNDEFGMKPNLSMVTRPLPATLHLREHARQYMLPAFFYCGPNGVDSALELRTQIPTQATLVWHRTESWESLLRFLSPEFEVFLFHPTFLSNDEDAEYRYASFRPSRLNDTPILIRRFIDPEVWSPGPMKSLGGALLRNLLGPPESSVLTALRQSAETLRTAMDDFNSQGRADFDRRYKLRMAATDEDGEGQ